jgi:hypothetical protein
MILTSGMKSRRFAAETVFNILFKSIVAQLSRYFKSKAKKVDEKSSPAGLRYTASARRSERRLL